MLESLEAKARSLDASTEELFLGNDHYFMKPRQVILAIISRTREDTISK